MRNLGFDSGEIALGLPAFFSPLTCGKLATVLVFLNRCGDEFGDEQVLFDRLEYSALNVTAEIKKGPIESIEGRDRNSRGLPCADAGRMAAREA